MNDNRTPAASPPHSVLFFESFDTLRGRAGRAAQKSFRRALDVMKATRPGPWRMIVREADAQRELARQLASESGLETQAADDAGAENWRSAADGRLILFAADRPQPPASLGGGAALWMAVRASDGQRWESDSSGQWQPPAWLDETLTLAGASLAEPVDAIFNKTDALAMTTAPDTRRSGTMLVMIEALCVVLPVVWLLRGPLDLPPMAAALAGMVSPLLVVSFCWWLRWRGMGRVWSRSRLVAEVCRAFMATRHTPAQPVVSLLSVVPALRPLVKKLAAEPLSEPAVKWRDDYIKQRLDDQHGHYSKQRDKALRERRKLTLWSTVLMDMALAVGCAGIVVTLDSRSAHWLDLFGGSWLDFALGLAGMALPLSLLVAQSLRQVGESTRRTARYTQQILQIENLRARLADATGPAAVELMREAENVLLSEVLDWYFQAETTEDFYTIREQPAVEVPEKSGVVKTSRISNLLWSGLRGLGSAAGFTVRVVLVRLFWVVLTAAFALMWISYRQNRTPEVSSRLLELGRMVNPTDGKIFSPRAVAAAHGTLIVVHGMRDGWQTPSNNEEHWTAGICSRVRERLGGAAPQMIVFDWHEGAKPSEQHELNTPDAVSGFLADLSGVSPNGQKTGDFLGIRLARMVKDGSIKDNKPLHLIGHSAGGFVVARAAHIVIAMGFPKERVHVTILDTPEPDDEITQYLATLGGAEFYRTSKFVRNFNLDPRIHFEDLKPPQPPADADGVTVNLLAHSYAWQWYRDGIATAKKGGKGFGRSPFCE